MENLGQNIVSFAIAALSELALPLPNLKFSVDHICFRVATDAEYEAMKQVLDTWGENILEEEVSGRMVSLFRLTQPIAVAKQCIRYIELPAPKEGKPFSSGLEHLDLVIAQPLESIPLEVDTSNLSKGKRPEISLRLPSGKVIKFANTHLLSE